MAEEPGNTPHVTPDQPQVRKGAPPPPVETRWKKGQSGNPGGRPKNRDLHEFFRGIPRDKDGKALEMDGQPLSRRQATLQAIWRASIDSKHPQQVRAAELVLAYEYGKPINRLEMVIDDPVDPDEFVDAGPPALEQLTTDEIRKQAAELRRSSAFELFVVKDDAAPEPVAVADGRKP